MRMIFGVLSLLFVVAIVGLLAKKQLTAVSAPRPALQANPAASAPGVQLPTGTPRQQVQQVQQAVQDAMQQTRPMPDEK